jgi:hypothetical protein
MFDTTPNETQYFYTDGDSSGAQLDGNSSYEFAFPPGQEPPVSGFWSMTLYNEHHFFHPNDLKRYSLGTKNKGLKKPRANCKHSETPTSLFAIMLPRHQLTSLQSIIPVTLRSATPPSPLGCPSEPHSGPLVALAWRWGRYGMRLAMGNAPTG